MRRSSRPAALALACAAALSCGAGGSGGGLRGAFEWVGYRTIQCQDPWSGQLPAENSALPSDELSAVDEFFRGQGIELIEVGFFEEGEFQCHACGCADGRLLVARASLVDASRLVEEFGFEYLPVFSREPWLETQPVQCGWNPWVETIPHWLDPFEESRSVKSWAESVGAPLAIAGIVYPTTRYSVLLACGLPRGDLLLVSPRSPSGVDILWAFGFARLFL